MTDQIQLDRDLVARHGFRVFVPLAWGHADTSVYRPARHIATVASVLDQMARDRYDGHGSELGIALPPGASKSMLASVLWQPWVWSWWPQARWITGGYDDSLAWSLGRKARDLVESDWYQARWPMRISGGVQRWENDRGGSRRCVGIGSRITGEHGHILVLDDPVKEQLTRLGTPAQISAAVQRSVDYWFSTLHTRTVDYTAAKILVHQRLHIDDPIGVAKRDHGYRVISYPARFDPDRADPLDHRTVPGEILCDRLTEDALAELEIRLGPRAARAQLDQDPVPLGGHILLEEYLAHRYALLPAELQQTMASGSVSTPDQRWITAWDLTFKGKPTSDYVVGQVWCGHAGLVYLVDQVRAQAGFLETERMIADLAVRYPWIHTHIIEDAANAAAITETLQRIPGVVLQPHGGGCLARVQQCEGIWASGAVRLPSGLVPWMGGSDGFVAEHLAFDGLGTRHDDQVSAASLAMLYLAQRDLPRWARRGK